MYKSAFLGCGGRARAHASAYRFVKGGKIGAICDMNEELLNKFGDDFDVSARYTDFDEMLEKKNRIYFTLSLHQFCVVLINVSAIR